MFQFVLIMLSVLSPALCHLASSLCWCQGQGQPTSKDKKESNRNPPFVLVTAKANITFHNPPMPTCIILWSWSLDWFCNQYCSDCPTGQVCGTESGVSNLVPLKLLHCKYHRNNRLGATFYSSSGSPCTTSCSKWIWLGKPYIPRNYATLVLNYICWAFAKANTLTN